MKLADGTKFVYLTVGGRTSAVGPSVQKKTGPVAKDVDEDGEIDGGKKGGKKRKAAPKGETDDEGIGKEKPVAKRGRAKKATPNPDDEDQEATKEKAAQRKGRARKATPKLEEEKEEEPIVDDDLHEGDEGQKTESTAKTNGITKTAKEKKPKPATIKEKPARRRRSGRVSGKEVSYAED